MPPVFQRGTPRWRRVISDARGGVISGDGDDGDGGADVSAASRGGFTVESESFLGDFIWHGFLPFASFRTPSGDYIQTRFLTRAASGDTAMQFWSDPFNSQSGEVLSTPSGALSINGSTGALTGQLSMTSIFTPGRVCAGSSYSYFADDLTVLYHSTDSLGDLIEGNYVYYSAVYETPLTKSYFANNPQPFPPDPADGYLVSYCGDAITGIGIVSETLSDEIGLGQVAANGGAVSIPPSFKSSVTSYNPGTGEMGGEASELTFNATEPSVNGYSVLTVRFAKSLTSGGPVEIITVQVAGAVTPGNFFTASLKVPMAVGYTIIYMDAVLVDLLQAIDTFEQFTGGEIFLGDLAGYETTELWPDIPAFNLQSGDPATMALTDWSNIGPVPLLLNDPSGFYWAGEGRFSAANFLECFEDFEDYANGTVFPPATFDRGDGWDAAGLFLTADYIMFVDDLATGTVGALPEYPATDASLIAISFAWWPPPFIAPGTGPQLVPADYAFFLVREYDLANDDFESYATGPVVLLDGGNGDWDGDGIFA